MYITFLIGNGFDIGLGLKTRYEDFYKKYCVVTEQDNINISSFKLMLSERNNDKDSQIIDWADFEKAFGAHSRDFTIETKDLYIERFEDFVSKFNAYLEAEEANLDYSQEDLIADTMRKAVTTYYHIRNADKIEIEKTYNNIQGKRYYQFISFNYTRTADTCAQILAKKLSSDSNREVGTVSHIHGYIDANMIMGVNDPSQIANEELRSDPDIVSEIVKPQQNVESRTNYEADVESAINRSHIICVYGMSLGATDKKWWNYISHWLAANASRKLVILKYDTNYNIRFTHSQRKVTNGVVSSFLSYSDLPDNKKTEILPRIYIGVNHNVFSMNLRKSDEEKNDDAPMLDELHKRMSKYLTPNLVG